MNYLKSITKDCIRRDSCLISFSVCRSFHVSVFHARRIHIRKVIGEIYSAGLRRNAESGLACLHFHTWRIEERASFAIIFLVGSSIRIREFIASAMRRTQTGLLIRGAIRHASKKPLRDGACPSVPLIPEWRHSAIHIDYPLFLQVPAQFRLFNRESKSLIYFSLSLFCVARILEEEISCSLHCKKICKIIGLMKVYY